MEERHQGGVADAAPPSDGLAAARAAFERGDFRETRRLAAKVGGPEGEELLAATRNDPLALWLGLGCLLFFIVVVWLTLK